jgi:hypothetical protein
VLHQVGVGALGPVFRTYEPTRDRLVAVKVFRLDITPEQAQQLADELAKAADAGLFHPSIVEPIAAGVEGTAAFRAEEYVAAESLDIAVRHYAPATVEKILPFITQMAGAIDFARTAGVGHGALHPRDVFVTPEEARITGFGVVEALQRVGIRAPVRRPYSAPERVAGEAWGTPADVFSLGAIAYELLTARRPSALGADIDAEGLTPAVHAVLVRALAENPEGRFSTALAFASALEAAGRGEAPAPSAPPARSKRSKSAAAAAAGVAAAAAATPPPADADDTLEHRPLRADVDERQGQASEPFDDIAAERDEDEAHLALIREEQAHAEAEELAQPASLFEAEDDEAVEDLALDSHLRAETDQFADEFMVASRDPVVAGGAAAGTASAIDSLREEVKAREARLERAREVKEELQRKAAADPYAGAVPLGGYAPPPPIHDRSRSPMFAVAIVAVLALLVGFLAGRAVGLREGRREAADAAARLQQESGATTQPKPFSDQSVNPAPDPPPVVGEGPPAADTASPPSAPPAAAAAETAAPPRPTAGRLVIDSTPRGASVTVNKKWLGRTPLTLETLPFGRHDVRVVQDGFAVAQESVALSEGTPSRTLSFRLKANTPAPARSAARTSKPAAPAPQQAPRSFVGTIYVDSRPRGARVYLDGKMVGVTPIRVPDVPIGSHVIRLTLEGHRDWSDSARVVANEERRITGSLDPIR